MSVYFFYGEEDFNIDLAFEEIKSRLNKDFSAMNYQVLDNPDYPELITALRTQPMMFGDMLIVINSEKYFSGVKNFFEDSEESEDDIDEEQDEQSDEDDFEDEPLIEEDLKSVEDTFFGNSMGNIPESFDEGEF